MDYVVRVGKTKVSMITTRTQEKAIKKAKKIYPNASILVERVRDTKVGIRDKWRRP